MKKAIPILLIATTLLVGCSKIISTETETVKATVTDANYRCSLILPIQCGKTVIHRTQPARYEITVKYGTVSTTINDRNLYNEYKDKVGSTIECELIIEHYDNGTTSQELKIKK